MYVEHTERTTSFHYWTNFSKTIVSDMVTTGNYSDFFELDEVSRNATTIQVTKKIITHFGIYRKLNEMHNSRYTSKV